MIPSRFAADSSLDLLARRLRFLGYDVASHRGARLEELFEAAAREERIVLTASHRHPRRYASVPRLAVPREDVVAALREVASRHEPSSAPFSRCALDNSPLQRRHVMEARGEVPGRVLRSQRSLGHCPMCGKWYWDGSHVARIREWLEAALGRPISAPGEIAGGPPEPEEPIA